LLPKLNLPETTFRIRESAGKLQIFDRIRKKFVVLTPEEWVRQHFIVFLHQQRNFPLSLMQNEQKVTGSQVMNRTDILVFNQLGHKVLVVECKAPAVKITQEVFDQVARYNSTLKVPFLAVTNGMNHFFCIINVVEGTFEYLPDCPFYEELKGL
jgi:hypothetical protein